VTLNVRDTMRDFDFKSIKPKTGQLYVNNDTAGWYEFDGEEWIPFLDPGGCALFTPQPRATSPPSSDPSGHQP